MEQLKSHGFESRTNVNFISDIHQRYLSIVISLFVLAMLSSACLLMPCLHETGLREVSAFQFQFQYNRNVNLPQANVSRVNTALDQLFSTFDTASGFE